MKSCIVFVVLGFLAACNLPTDPYYLGIYEVRYKKADFITRSEFRNIAETIMKDLNLKFDDIMEDSLALNLTVRQGHGGNDKSSPGLVFSYVTVPGDSWGITITKSGPEEDQTVQNMRAKIEKTLNEAAPGKWTYSIAHHSMAKP